MADNVVVTVPEKQIIAGRDGFDPIIESEPILGGHRLWITGRSTMATFPVMDGTDGLSAYQQAVIGGYEGTEAQFNQELRSFKTLSEQAATSAESAAAAQEAAETAQEAAEEAQGAAESSATAASESASNAATSASEASSYASNAASSATAASGSAGSASASAAAAASAQSAAEAAQSAAEAAQSAAEAAQSAAASSASSASSSATAAGNAQVAAEDAQAAAEDAAESVSQSAAQISQNASDINDLKSALDYNGINNAFDGHLYNGFWSSSGVLTPTQGDVCCAAKIPCPGNANVVHITKTAVTDYTVYISYFDEAGTTRLRRDIDNTGKYEGVSPAGTYWYTFTYEKYGINKETFGTVEVYINNAIFDMASDIETLGDNVDALGDNVDILDSKIDAIANDVGDIIMTYTNVFDKSAEYETGYLENGTVIGSIGRTYDYIEITRPGTYISNCIPKGLYGESFNKSVAFYDSSKTYLRNASITIVTDNINNSVGTFTIASDVAYIRVSMIGNNTSDTAMVIYGSTLPESYVPHGVTRITSDDFISIIKGNVLFGKVAVFDGDSICAVATDVSGNGSYAGRISLANGLIIHNYAVGGGTITSETYSGSTPKHWIVDSIDTVHTAYPNADYIILEGGTNDADIIGSILNGNTPERFGSFDVKDFSGEYDDETFCGAVETLFYKAINYWPSKKIGFVIAMKMGKTSNGYKPETNNRRAYFETIMNICDKWGIPYLNLWDNCYMNPSLDVCYDNTMTPQENVAANKLYGDGQHPTPKGYDYIAPIIGEWMKTL